MLSPRHLAQLGLSAACLTLVTSITVLVAGASDTGRSTSEQSTASHVTPLATGLQSDLSQPAAHDKQ